jgi:hypothetical protein
MPAHEVFSKEAEAKAKAINARLGFELYRWTPAFGWQKDDGLRGLVPVRQSDILAHAQRLGVKPLWRGVSK